MLRLRTRPAFGQDDRTFWIIAIGGFSLMLGLASLKVPMLSVIGVLAAVLGALAVFKRPELSLVGILLVTSSFIFEGQLPMVSLGAISLSIPDILLLGSLGLIVVRWLADREFKIVRTPLDPPLLIFFGATVLSTLVALSRSSVDFVDARRALRTLSYYLAFFVVTNLVREARQLNFLLNSLFLLAALVAAAMIVQFLLGQSVQLLPGRVESMGVQDLVYEDIMRILPPGLSLVLVSFATLLCILVLGKEKSPKWPIFLQCGLTGIALVLTFLRSYWAALIVVFFLLAYIVRGRDRRSLIRWSLAAAFSAALVLLVIFSDPGSRAGRLVGAAVDRLGTLGRRETYQGGDNSWTWRRIENKYALSAIASHPVIGLGMGANYRPRDLRLDRRNPDLPKFNFRGYIHNGHLWILLQSGFFGYLSLMWLSAAFLLRGFRNWRRITADRMRGMVLGFPLVYVAILIAALLNPVFTQAYWTPLIGIMMGMNEVVLGSLAKAAPAA